MVKGGEIMFNQYPYINENDLNLDYILAKVKNLLDRVGSLEGWRVVHEAEYEQLESYYNDLVSGNLNPALIAAINQWCTLHITDLVGELVKIVFFGITDDGYFVAYIPDSWNDIVFGTTGLDDFPPGVDFGHLTLSY